MAVSYINPLVCYSQGTCPGTSPMVRKKEPKVYNFPSWNKFRILSYAYSYYNFSCLDGCACKLKVTGISILYLSTLVLLLADLLAIYTCMHARNFAYYINVSRHKLRNQILHVFI